MRLFIQVFAVVTIAAGLLGCPVPTEQRSIVAIVGKRASGTDSLNEMQVLTVLSGVAERLYAAGFVRESLALEDRPKQPFLRGQYLGGGYAYSAVFIKEPGLRCGVLFDRAASISVSFYERANLPHNSHVYPASGMQREAVCMLSKQIASYLHANLPPSYPVEIEVATRHL